MFGKMGKWLFAALLVLVAGAAALNMGQKAAQWVLKENQLLAQAGGQAVRVMRSVGEAGQTFLDRAGEQQMTLLVTGTDNKGSDADIIMLVSIDQREGSLRVLQIPRRTYVRRSNASVTQLHELYASVAASARRRGDSKEEAIRKGNIALKGFLKVNMGIGIDHYISLSEEGIRSVIDSLGGITVTLPAAIDCDEDSRGLHVHLSEGKQYLGGTQAAALLRLDDPSADTRTARRVLAALFGQIKRELSLSTALSLLRTGIAQTVSDLTLPDLVPLTRAMLGISASQVTMDTLGTLPCEDGSDSLLLDRAQAIRQLADCLSYQEGIDEAHFDPHRVFDRQ